MSYYIWTYKYQVGTAVYMYNARNRKEADARAAADGVPASAFVSRHN